MMISDKLVKKDDLLSLPGVCLTEYASDGPVAREATAEPPSRCLPHH